MFGRWSRRDLLKTSGAVGGVAMAPLAAGAAQAQALPLQRGTDSDNVFTHIGVRPIVNASGTYTIISGSRSLPEVKQAMFEASHYFVQMDEMMDAIGGELAKLTGAEWGIVTNGCEAAICLATLACIAGGDVEKSQALPYVKAKDQVIVPGHSRNPYDVGVRMVGAEIVEVDTTDELHTRISERTAMIYVMSDPREAKSALPIRAICTIAREHSVPVFVDAAAEEPIKPNIHLAAGATLVAYSGGKCLRGPQSSGMLLGDKSLCRAAYLQAAPHHNYGRALKCSKEESMGLLAAVRQWYKRDHDSEQRMWRAWLETIAARLKPLPVTFEYLQPADLSNRSTRLRIHWDARQLGITGTEVVARLDEGTPRIRVESGTGTRPDRMESTLTIMPYMMDPGEERVVANALFTVMSNPGRIAEPVLTTGAPASLQGRWAVTVKYLRGEGQQQFVLSQSADKLTGTHKGEIYQGAMTGHVRGDTVTLHSRMPISGSAIEWAFKGRVQGGALSGTVDMGEYGPAGFTAVRT
jgi:uncharacterized pyridoxal phosphate-dependent enzyme